MDSGAWPATVHGITKSWTWLSNFHSLSLGLYCFILKRQQLLFVFLICHCQINCLDIQLFSFFSLIHHLNSLPLCTTLSLYLSFFFFGFAYSTYPLNWGLRFYPCIWVYIKLSHRLLMFIFSCLLLLCFISHSFCCCTSNLLIFNSDISLIYEWINDANNLSIVFFISNIYFSFLMR